MRWRRFSSISRRRAQNRVRNPPSDDKRRAVMSTEVENDPAKSEAEGRDTNPEDFVEEAPSEAPATTVPAADVARSHLKGLIEALVFVSEHPLSINEIAKAASGADKKL